ncbi:hypothetical protein LguiA_026336 [Lonicera macranthoides]
MATKNILLLALVLVLSLAIKTISAQTVNETLMTRPGCQYRCNNTTIPYPFGIGPNCYRDASFEIDCDSSSGTPTPYVNGTVLEVLEITVSNGQIRVSNPDVTSLGVNLTGRPFRYYNVTAVSAVLEWSTYDIDECASNSTNRCTMGCENFLGGYRCLCDPGYELFNNFTCRYINGTFIIDPPKPKSKAVIIATQNSSLHIVLAIAKQLGNKISESLIFSISYHVSSLHT